MTGEKSLELIKTAVAAMDDKKAINICIIDIRNISVIADYFIIASGSNPNQVKAIIDNVDEKLHESGFDEPKLEGYNQASWILMDYEDVVIHVLSEEDRAFYDIERVWRDGIIINPDEFRKQPVT